MVRTRSERLREELSRHHGGGRSRPRVGTKFHRGHAPGRGGRPEGRNRKPSRGRWPNPARRVGDVHQPDQRHRRADQPAGAECHDRGGPGGGGRKGLRRGCLGGEEPGDPDREGDGRDFGTDRLDPDRPTGDAAGAIEGIARTIGEVNEIASGIASAVEQQGGRDAGDRPQRSGGGPGHQRRLRQHRLRQRGGVRVPAEPPSRCCWRPAISRSSRRSCAPRSATS